VADVKPFICRRPQPALAAEVAALPYDVFSRREAAAEIAAHPHSFLRIDKTTALFPDEVDEYDERVYSAAAEILADDEQTGVYLCEDTPHYFLYRLQKGGHAQTGVVACIAVEDYTTGVLKRHENTRAFKLEDRVRHISALNAQTGPVFVTYRAQEIIDQAVTQVTLGTDPLYDFTTQDAVKHTVWRVDDPEIADRIQAGFAALDALYIADGHHRAAASAQIGAQRQDAEAQHFLTIAFPSNQLDILDYNRVVFDTSGLSRDELLARIAQRFDVQQVDTHTETKACMGTGASTGGQAEAQESAPLELELPLEPHHARPTARGEFAMRLDGAWYRLTIHEGLRSDDPVAGLDVSLLQEYLLGPVLGIDDPRSSKRIAYVGGVRGLDELERRTAEGGVAFALFPCSLDELFAVADTGRLMPPKSTWFEPKPRSGLFIHEITSAIPAAAATAAAPAAPTIPATSIIREPEE
jgi:uncharacterized protein (DUF1015 family)